MLSFMGQHFVKSISERLSMPYFSVCRRFTEQVMDSVVIGENPRLTRVETAFSIFADAVEPWSDIGKLMNQDLSLFAERGCEAVRDYFSGMIPEVWAAVGKEYSLCNDQTWGKRRYSDERFGATIAKRSLSVLSREEILHFAALMKIRNQRVFTPERGTMRWIAITELNSALGAIDVDYRILMT